MFGDVAHCFAPSVARAHEEASFRGFAGGGACAWSGQARATLEELISLPAACRLARLLAVSFTMLPLKNAMIPMGLYVPTVGGLMIWLGTVPGDAAANRFGEPPARGFGLTRLKKVTLA